MVVVGWDGGCWMVVVGFVFLWRSVRVLESLLLRYLPALGMGLLDFLRGGEYGIDQTRPGPFDRLHARCSNAELYCHLFASFDEEDGDGAVELERLLVAPSTWKR